MKRRSRLIKGVKRALGRKDLWVTYPSVIAGGLIWSIAINGILIHNQFLSGGAISSGFSPWD
jgi:hypothetical protein